MKLRALLLQNPYITNEKQSLPAPSIDKFSYFYKKILTPSMIFQKHQSPINKGGATLQFPCNSHKTKLRFIFDLL